MSSIIGTIVDQEAKNLGLLLSDHQIQSFELYAAELIKWNSKVNLTAITKDKEIAVKHFIDSLSVVPYITVNDRLLDIGSGAGLPVIPLKIIRPEIPMVSVDAVAKKIHFQRHILRILNMPDIEAIHARVEALPKTYTGAFTVITSRAFTRLDHFVSLAAPLLAEGGVLIAMKGEGADSEIASNDGIIRGVGFAVTSIQRYSLPCGMGERALMFLKRFKSP